MKKTRRILGIMFVLVLVGALAVVVSANETCTNGHNPNMSWTYLANYTVCGGGYAVDHYTCRDCYLYCDAEGNTVDWTLPVEDHVFSDLIYADEVVHYCNGWFEEDHYYCKVCDYGYVEVTYDGGATGYDIATWHSPKDDETVVHTPVGEKHSASVGCGDAYASDYYDCANCPDKCDENGVEIEYIGVSKTGHVPNMSGYREPDFLPCTGGYTVLSHPCLICGASCDDNGDLVMWEEPTDPHNFQYLSSQNAVHYCNGWYEDCFVCTWCGYAVSDVNDPPANPPVKVYPEEGDFVIHSPSGSVIPADYTPCGGGYMNDHYNCRYCEQVSDADGVEVPFYGIAETGHTVPSGYSPVGPDYAPCTGGREEAYYWCDVCRHACNANGDYVPHRDAVQEHTFGELQLAVNEVHRCSGWYAEDYYLCSTCNIGYIKVDAEPEAYYEQAMLVWPNSNETVVHRPAGELHPAEGPACGTGYKQDYYYCEYCNRTCDENGAEVVYSEVSLTGHVPDMRHFYPAVYYPCRGGYASDRYSCRVCGYFCDAEGNLVPWISATQDHSFGALQLAEDVVKYCTGWYCEDYYFCNICETGYVPMDDGNGGVYYRNANTAYPDTYDECMHFPGDEGHAPNYTACGGGYTEEWYFCDNCVSCVNAEGEYLVELPDAPNGHVPYTYTKHIGEYIPCRGGFTSDYYDCELCGTYCDIDGNLVTYTDASEPHNFEYQTSSTAVHYCHGWYENCYVCTGCGMAVVSIDELSPDYMVTVNERVYPEDGDVVVHTPRAYLYEADYTVCGGGYKHDYYECRYCLDACDADGDEVEFFGISQTGHSLPECSANPADYTPCMGGYDQDYYQCYVCNHMCNINGEYVPYREPTSDHVLGDMCYAEDEVRYCTGWYVEDYQKCIFCDEALVAYTDENMETWYRSAKRAWPDHPGDCYHILGEELYPATKEDCGGGYAEDYYMCVNCGAETNAEGEFVPFSDPDTTGHTPGSHLNPADYLPCAGGYKTDWYTCTKCGCACDADGNYIEWCEAEEEHIFGELHLASDEVHDCNGWYMEDYYPCTVCGEGFVIMSDGYNEWYIHAPYTWPSDYSDVVHVPAGERYPADYCDCGGGYKVEHYTCAYCWYRCDENGELVEYTEGTGAPHTPFVHFGFNAMPNDCYRDFSKPFTVCIYCNMFCFADGSDAGTWLDLSEEPAHNYVLHHASDEVVNSCVGWFTEDYYLCEDCGIRYAGVGPDGKPDESVWPDPVYHEGTDLIHNLYHFPAKSPTATETGHQEFWLCLDCLTIFLDEGCNTYAYYFADILIDALGGADGWVSEGGNWYYYADGVKQTGWIQVDGSWYYMNANGVMQTGWVKDGSSWYYTDIYGVMQTGWVQTGGAWYYMDIYGVMQTGWLKISGSWYYMNASGVMQTGWQKIDGSLYYMNASGVWQIYNGWQKVESKWYYFSAGVAQTGWVKAGGAWYYMNASGVMQTGWVQAGGAWYYMNASGVMQTGWVQAGGAWYYMNASGVMQTGWVKDSGVWYYMNASGVMQTGWVYVGGYWYYMNASGVMVANKTLTIGGIKYTFDANGVWVA